MAKDIQSDLTLKNVYLVDTARRALPLATLFTPEGLGLLRLTHDAEMRRSAGYVPYYLLHMQAPRDANVNDRYWLTPDDTSMLQPVLALLNRTASLIEARVQQFERAHAALTDLKTAEQVEALTKIDMRLPQTWPAGRNAVLTEAEVRKFKLPARKPKILPSTAFSFDS